MCDCTISLPSLDTFDFGDCLSLDDVETIKSHVEEGKNVIVSRHHVDGTSHQLEMLSPSGATYNDETGVACYPMPDKPGKVYCIFPDSEVCEAPENRRRLAHRGNCRPNSNRPHCQAASCECNQVPTCLGVNDSPIDGIYPECADMACMLPGCTFTCPAISNVEGRPCSCEGTVVCNTVMTPDCSNCRV